MTCSVAFAFTKMITNEKLDYLEAMAERGLAVLHGHYTMTAILDLVEEVRCLQAQLNQTIHLLPKVLLVAAENENQSGDAEIPP